LKFAYGLSSAATKAGATVHERSPVRTIRETRNEIVVETENGTVSAKCAILACDAFSGSVAPELAKYIGHVESFIVATEPMPADKGLLLSDAAVADTRHVLDYYRKTADHRLLFAGRESYFSPPKYIARLVRPRMLRVFPSLRDIRIEYAWSGTVGITYTRMPHFGRLGERLLFGHGYSGHGVALSVIGGKALADAAMGQTDRFDVLARVPATPFPGGQWLRKPMISTALTWYKIVDAL
jgi:gamma-glutamylputrescine oxidase